MCYLQIHVYTHLPETGNFKDFLFRRRHHLKVPVAVGVPLEDSGVHVWPSAEAGQPLLP